MGTQKGTIILTIPHITLPSAQLLTLSIPKCRGLKTFLHPGFNGLGICALKAAPRAAGIRSWGTRAIHTCTTLNLHCTIIASTQVPTVYKLRGTFALWERKRRLRAFGRESPAEKSLERNFSTAASRKKKRLELEAM